MTRLTTIFFDAGNTLVFPNLDRTLAPLHQRDVRPTKDQLHAAERKGKSELDKLNANSQGSSDRQYWEMYYSHLLELLGIRDKALEEDLIRSTRVSANWDVVLPGTHELLVELGRKYKLGLISNSDGSVAAVLKRCGIGDCFLAFTDSGLVGFEKPNAAIFGAALNQLSARPEESLYVGDTYSVDYVGAINVGMRGLLLDVAGTYRDSGLPRIERLNELEGWLKSYDV